MASWDKNKVLPENLNNGNEYANGDVPSLDTFNDANNNAFYAVDFAEAMADTPDTTNVGNVGTPAISLIDNVKNGITYKKFKFENLKGDHGANIVNSGEWNSTTEYVNNANQIDVVVHNANLYICNTTNTNSEPTSTNTNWSLCANGIVSAVVNGMNISVTFADGTTSVITITGDTVELSEIEIDTTPTANSTNVVTSGGVFTAIANVFNTVGESTATDLNNIADGLTMYNANTLNQPFTGGYGMCLQFRNDVAVGASTSWLFQIAITVGNDFCVRSNINNAGWSAWVEK